MVCCSQVFSVSGGWWYAVARCSQCQVGGGMLKPGVLSTRWVVCYGQMFSVPGGWWYAVARCSQYLVGGSML